MGAILRSCEEDRVPIRIVLSRAVPHKFKRTTAILDRAGYIKVFTCELVHRIEWVQGDTAKVDRSPNRLVLPLASADEVGAQCQGN